MAKKNIFDVILNTINDVQKKNKANPKEETADPNVFDLIKGKLQKLDEKNRAKRVARGKSPSSILDLIKKEIVGARRENKRDPNVKTAPASIFDKILKKVDDRPRRQAGAGLRGIVEEYGLDVGRLPAQTIQQVQEVYIQKRKEFDKQFAQELHNLIKQQR